MLTRPNPVLVHEFTAGESKFRVIRQAHPVYRDNATQLILEQSDTDALGADYWREVMRVMEQEDPGPISSASAAAFYVIAQTVLTELVRAVPRTLPR